MGRATLTRRQELFCLEYLKDNNATQAAIRAGYSPKAAAETGYENLRKPQIADRIAAVMAERCERVQIDADWVLRQAAELHRRCMQEVEPVMVGSGRERRQLIDEDGRLVFAFDAQGAARALEIVGRHVGVQAFKDRVDLVVADHEAGLTLALQRAAEASRAAGQTTH